jgi:hypothetical protein
MKDKSEIEQPGTPNATELTTVEGKRLAAAASDRGRANYSTAIMIVRLVCAEFNFKMLLVFCVFIGDCKFLGCVLTSPFSPLFFFCNIIQLRYSFVFIVYIISLPATCSKPGLATRVL